MAPSKLLLFLFLLAIHLTSCYVFKFSRNKRNSFRLHVLSNSETGDNSASTIIDIKDSIRQEISEIINVYMQKCAENVPLSSINPGILIDNSFLLSKVGFYEEIMEEYLNACTSLEEVLRIEKVDGFLRKFISSERKSRSRLKINYLMAGATSNRFEEAVQTLSDW